MVVGIQFVYGGFSVLHIRLVELSAVEELTFQLPIARDYAYCCKVNVKMSKGIKQPVGNLKRNSTSSLRTVWLKKGTVITSRSVTVMVENSYPESPAPARSPMTCTGLLFRTHQLH